MSILNQISRAEFMDRLVRFFSHKHVRHSLAWVGLFLLLLLVREGPLFTQLTDSALTLLFFMIIVYYNFYYLIPNFLEKKQVWLYFLLLILTIVIILPIYVMAFYLKYSNSPGTQQEVLREIGTISLGLIFVAGVSTILKISSDWMRHQRERKELQTQNMQSELRFLKSQVNPHFLFNTLNSLYALTLKKSDKAPEIVIKLSEMMRYMLYECNERYVPLYKEINYLKNYLELEKLRQGGDIEIDFQMRGDLSDQRIAPMMFIPFLENSFKHGINKQINRGFVHIDMEVRDHEVDVCIENSKPGTAPEPQRRRSGGIGLENVRRRLDLIYPNRYKLKISDAPDIYRVNLKIKLD